MLALLAFGAAIWPDGLSKTRIAAADNTVTVDLSTGESAGINFTPLNVSFDPPSCNEFIGSADVCTDFLRVQNVGIEATYTIAAWVDANTTDDGQPGPVDDDLIDCFNLHLTQDPASGQPVGNDSSQGPIGPLSLDDGAENTWRLDAAVDDDNACQGLTGTLFVRVSAVGIEVPTATPTETLAATEEPSSTPTEVSTLVPTETPPAPTVIAPQETPVEPIAEVQEAQDIVEVPEERASPEAEEPPPVVAQAQEPTPTVSPSPTPAPPEPEPTAATTEVDSVYRPSLLDRIADVDDISLSFESVLTNTGLAALLLVVVLIDTTIFNSILKENSSLIHDFFGSKFASVTGFFGKMDGVVDNTIGRGLAIRPILILLMSSLVYSLLDSNFGWNESSLVLFFSLFLGLGIATYANDGGQVFVAEKRFGIPYMIQFFPAAMLIAGVSVILSRISGIHPGIIFGFIAGAREASFIRADDRQHGLIIFIPMVTLVCISVAAWLAISPARSLGSEHSLIGAIFEAACVMLFLSSIQGLLFSLIPVSFMDGQKIWRWSKLAWLSVALPVCFLYFHIVVNSGGTFSTASTSNGMRVLYAFAIAAWIVTGVAWLYFRRLARKPKVEVT